MQARDLCRSAPGCFYFNLADRNASAHSLAAQPGVAAAAHRLGYADLRAFVHDAQQHLELVHLLAAFTLTPPGDSATRRGLWEALLAGSVPVVFSERSRHFPLFLPPAQLDDLTVLLDGDVFLAMQNGGQLLDALRPAVARLPQMRAALEARATTFQYSAGDHGAADAAAVGPDAVDVLLAALLRARGGAGRGASDWLALPTDRHTPQSKKREGSF